MTKRDQLVTELEGLFGRKIDSADLNVDQLKMMIASMKSIKLSKAENKKGKGIQDVACRLLTEVALEFEGKSYGLSYEAICAKIKEEIPSADTKKASLQWYESKIRGNKPGFEEYHGKLPVARLKG